MWIKSRPQVKMIVYENDKTQYQSRFLGWQRQASTVEKTEFSIVYSEKVVKSVVNNSR
jgi:hypothetical protein